MNPPTTPSSITPHAPLAMRPSPSAFLSRLQSNKFRISTAVMTTDSLTINSEDNVTSLYIGAKPISQGMLLMQDRFSISPDCPYFYVFGGYVPMAEENAWATDEAGIYCGRTVSKFTYGGTNVVEYVSYWGDKTLLWQFLANNPSSFNNAYTAGDPAISSEIVISPYIGVPSFVVQSAYAGNCTIFDQTYSDAGFSCKWSCVADQVEMTSYLLNGPVLATPEVETLYSGAEFFHGLLQQPQANG